MAGHHGGPFHLAGGASRSRGGGQQGQGGRFDQEKDEQISDPQSPSGEDGEEHDDDDSVDEVNSPAESNMGRGGVTAAASPSSDDTAARRPLSCNSDADSDSEIEIVDVQPAFTKSPPPTICPAAAPRALDTSKSDEPLKVGTASPVLHIHRVGV